MQVPLTFRFALAVTLSLAQGAASVRAQSVPQGSDEVELSTFYVGEFDRPTFSLWGPRLACGVNLEEWAKARCRGRRTIVKQVTDGVAGNRCGYQGFALVCFNR